MPTRRNLLKMTGAATSALALSTLLSLPAVAQNRSVAVQLAWLPGADFAGEIVALETGAFAARGLDVTLLPGGPGTNSVQELLSGTSDISITYAPPIMYSANRGLPLASFAAAVQRAPLTFFSLGEANITSVADWEGKRIGAGQGAIPQIKAVLSENGLTFDDITFVQAQVPGLMQDQVDVVGAWPTNVAQLEPVTSHPGGYNTQSIWDNGLQFQSNYYIARQETLDDDREMLVAFMEAADEGWAFAADNPAEAVALMQRYAPALGTEATLQSLQTLIADFVYTDETASHGFGYISSERWQRTLDTYAGIGEISEDLTSANVFDSRVLEEATRTHR